MGDEFNFNDLDSLLEPVDKDKNKEKMLAELDTAFTHGNPFIVYCEGYVYLAYPTGSNEWTELSFIREDGQLRKESRDNETMFHVIKEEIIRGLSEIVPDLNVNQVNDIATNSKNDPKAFVDTVVAQLPSSIPIIRSKDEIGKAIDLVKSA